jgi:Flp pilus assembly protein TadD
MKRTLPDRLFYRLTPVVVIMAAVAIAFMGWRYPPGIDTPTREGTHALNRGNYLQAIRSLSRAQQRCETDIWARFHLGRAYAGYGWEDEALAAYDAAWRLARDMGVRAQEESGRIWLARNQAARAAEHLERAAALAPGRPQSWHLLGLARLEQGDLSAAEHCFSTAVRLDPGNDRYRQDLLAVALKIRQIQAPASPAAGPGPDGSP